MALTQIATGMIADAAVTTAKITDANITAAKLASGAARSNFGAGTVLQVVSTTYNTYSSTASTTYANLFSASITPLSTSSKILVMVNCVGCTSASSGGGGSFQVTRAGSLIFVIDSIVAYNSTSTQNRSGATGTTYLDSPASTSSLTYAVQWKSVDTNTFRINDYTYAGGNGTSTITLMEIAG